MARTMRDEGILTGPLESGEAFTMQFIEQIYEGTNP
jgi:hypothetical protein